MASPSAPLYRTPGSPPRWLAGPFWDPALSGSPPAFSVIRLPIKYWPDFLALRQSVFSLLPLGSWLSFHHSHVPWANFSNTTKIPVPNPNLSSDKSSELRRSHPNSEYFQIVSLFLHRCLMYCWRGWWSSFGTQSGMAAAAFLVLGRCQQTHGGHLASCDLTVYTGRVQRPSSLETTCHDMWHSILTQKKWFCSSR